MVSRYKVKIERILEKQKAADMIMINPVNEASVYEIYSKLNITWMAPKAAQKLYPTCISRGDMFVIWISEPAGQKVHKSPPHPIQK